VTTSVIRLVLPSAGVLILGALKMSEDVDVVIRSEWTESMVLCYFLWRRVLVWHLNMILFKQSCKVESSKSESVSTSMIGLFTTDTVTVLVQTMLS
jgi:hypothetical protein